MHSLYPTLELSAIEFDIATREQILAQSVVLICSTERTGDGSVYDTRMGPLHNEQCKTCLEPANVCVGHFGHIELVQPVVSPLFAAHLQRMANWFCHNCSQPVSMEQPGKSAVKHICCQHCGKHQVQIQIDIGLSIIETSVPETAKKGAVSKAPEAIETFCKLTGIECETGKKTVSREILPAELLARVTRIADLGKFRTHPRDMFLSVLPVLPHMNRSSVNQGESQSDDELTTQYLEIIKNNRRLLAPGLSREQTLRALERLSFSINVLINNSRGKAKHPSSCRKIKSLTERLSGKSGLMRAGIQGKRCDKSARAVCAPGPELEHGEIGVPEACAKILSRVRRADLFSLAELQAHCDSDHVNLVERLCTIHSCGSAGGLPEPLRCSQSSPERKCQPQVCKFSPLKFCHIAQTKLEPGDMLIRAQGLSETVRTGREVLQTGDQILREGQILEAKPAERRRFILQLGDLVHVQLQEGDRIISNRQPTLHSGSIQSHRVKIIKDFCSRSTLSSTGAKGMDFDGDEQNLHLPQTEQAEREMLICDSRRQIINASTGEPMMTLVQDSVVGLWFMSQTAAPVNLDLVDQVRYDQVCKVRKQCGIRLPAQPDTFCLISQCLDPSLVVDLEQFQIVCGVWISGLLTKGTIRLLIKIAAAELGTEACSDMISKLQKISVRWLTRRGYTISGRDIRPIPYDQVREDALCRAEQGDDARAIRDAQHSHVVELGIGQGFRIGISSGAKGAMINLGQMLCCVGQQTSEMEKLRPMMKGGRVFCSDKPATNRLEELELSGFIVAGFGHCLNWREFFMHAVNSRSDVVRTSTGTASSGYLQHRIVKIVEDVFVEHGCLVLRGGPGQSRTLSLCYNNGADPRVATRRKIHQIKHDADICYRIDEQRQN